METATPLERVADIILQLAVILVAAKIGGEVVERLFKQPAVLGELAAGVLISPFALGGMSIGSVGPLFELPHGEAGGGLPVAPELFFLAQLAAVILLFETGLATNRRLFLRYARPASVVATGGVVLPFIFGLFATVWFGYASFDSVHALVPALFVGAVMTATSVGITARVLSDIHKLDTPEGVTILAAAVVDDVLGIIVLAVVVGVGSEGSVSAGGLAGILFKAVGFWLGLTIIGSVLATRISWLVSLFKGGGANVAVALALVFIAAAVAEQSAGLAMIIGSYSLGLALSGPDLKRKVEEPMLHINLFLVPVFFVVVGMQVDFSAFGETASLGRAIAFAAAITALAIVSKVAGSGLPALMVGFNRLGATRIGLGMLPRGEVALIIAGIGVASGAVGRLEFGVAVVMTVVTTVVAPVFLVPALKRPGTGLKPEADRGGKFPTERMIVSSYLWTRWGVRRFSRPTGRLIVFSYLRTRQRLRRFSRGAFRRRRGRPPRPGG